MLNYGQRPIVVQPNVQLESPEMMFYMYLPIKMAGIAEVKIPQRLEFLRNTIFKCIEDYKQEKNMPLPELVEDVYVYLTFKHLWVEPGCPGNRPGWHVDGWGSDGDINYIWSNMNPTQFAIQDFVNVPDDDFGSLQAFEDQADNNNIFEFGNGLLRLDETMVHRVNPNVKPGFRSFFKLSISKHKYNLKGNSRNYLFDYDWEMHDRMKVRNCDNSDFVREKA